MAIDLVQPSGSMWGQVATAIPRSAREDRRLAERLRRREREALRETYDRFGRSTFGFLVHLLGDRATAEDVMQQVFLQVWQRADSYDPARGGLLTWILTIARSRAIDELRRRVPEPHDPSESDVVTALDHAEADALIERWHLADLLTRLPEGEAELLRRRFYGGQTQAQIAEELGLPLGTVKSRMRSGLDGLRAMMEGDR